MSARAPARLLEFCGATDVGRRRQNNEDAIACDEALGLAIVADGMGGHLAGEVASSLAAGEIRKLLGAALDGQAEPAQAVRAAVEEANREIHRRAAHDPVCAGMGTTLALLLERGGNAVIAHVGDSRVYRLRGGVLEQLTADHSLVQELIDTGFLSVDEARNSANRNVITRALGIAEEVEVDLRTESLEAGDLYLLCSDGLTDLVPDARIGELLNACGSPAAAARALVEEANANGGLDNISVILARATEAAGASAREEEGG